LEKAVQNIVTVQKEHLENKAKYRYSVESPALLSNVVNPVILKLTKEHDSSGMAELGPIYSPSHP
jgi:hypothetical protein